MHLSDPTATALDVLARSEHPGWWSALPGMLRTALARWPGHPDLVDTLTALVLDERFAMAQGPALISVCLDAAAAMRKADSAPLLAHAAQLTWIFHDADRALGLLIDALSANPADPDARAFLSELLAAADPHLAWADALETLALRAVRGDVDRAAVLDILAECAPVCPAPRARALLGR